MVEFPNVLRRSYQDVAVLRRADNERSSVRLSKISIHVGSNDSDLRTDLCVFFFDQARPRQQEPENAKPVAIFDTNNEQAREAAHC